MKRNPKASFYALEVSVEPGGAREHLLFALNSLSAIREELDNCLIGEVYLTLWYGRTITLTTFQNGEVVDVLDLLPCITYHIDGYPPIGFVAKDVLTGLSRAQIRADKVLTDTLWRQGSNEQKADAPHIRYEVDWTRISPPALTGNVLQPGDQTRVDETVLGYGGNDLEEGLFLGEGDEEQDLNEWEEEWMEAEEKAGADDEE